MPVAPDAATVLGPAADADLAGIEDLARGRYKDGVREVMVRDFVTMYHPDGTSSIVQLPPLPADGRPQGKAMQERQQKILHYTMNKRREGKQWWFASPPADWTPAPLPYRCPVQFCARAGGMPDLLNLWRHIQHKHPEETDLYQGVLTAIKDKLEQAVPADLQKLLDPDQFQEDAAVASLGAEDMLPTEPAVPPETFEGNPYTCRDCDYKPKKRAKRPAVALMMHRRIHEGSS